MSCGFVLRVKWDGGGIPVWKAPHGRSSTLCWLSPVSLDGSPGRVLQVAASHVNALLYPEQGGENEKQGKKKRTSQGERLRPSGDS